MHKYTYSFIIPHYNSPELLNRCLDSIPQREDIQIIIVDDNSLEEKRPNVNRHDIEIVYVDAEHSKGAGHARNEGLARATGKWLLFPDCDDYYSTDLISVLDEYCDKDIEVLYFCFSFVDGNTNKLLPELRFEKYWREYDGTSYAKDQIKFHHNVPWTKMVSSDFVNKNNIRFEEVANGNDILFSMKVGYYATKIAVEKKKLYVYLKNENSILNKKPTASSLFCKITHKIKQNAFYSHIGHQEWRISIVKYVKGCLRKLSVKERIALASTFLGNSVSLFKDRKEWTNF